MAGKSHYLDRYLKPKLRSKSANTVSYVEERVSIRFNLVPRGRKTWERGLYLSGQLQRAAVQSEAWKSFLPKYGIGELKAHVYVNKEALPVSTSRRITKTRIEFNYFIHNCFLIDQ